MVATNVSKSHLQAGTDLTMRSPKKRSLDGSGSVPLVWSRMSMARRSPSWTVENRPGEFSSSSLGSRYSATTGTSSPPKVFAWRTTRSHINSRVGVERNALLAAATTESRQILSRMAGLSDPAAVGVGAPSPGSGVGSYTRMAYFAFRS